MPVYSYHLLLLCFLRSASAYTAERIPSPPLSARLTLGIKQAPSQMGLSPLHLFIPRSSYSRRSISTAQSHSLAAWGSRVVPSRMVALGSRVSVQSKNYRVFG